MCATCICNKKKTGAKQQCNRSRHVFGDLQLWQQYLRLLLPSLYPDFLYTLSHRIRYDTHLHLSSPTIDMCTHWKAAGLLQSAWLYGSTYAPFASENQTCQENILESWILPGKQAHNTAAIIVYKWLAGCLQWLRQKNFTCLSSLSSWYWRRYLPWHNSYVQ